MLLVTVLTLPKLAEANLISEVLLYDDDDSFHDSIFLAKLASSVIDCVVVDCAEQVH